MLMLDVYCTALRTSVFLYQYHGNSLFRIENVTFFISLRIKNAVSMVLNVFLVQNKKR